MHALQNMISFSYVFLRIRRNYCQSVSDWTTWRNLKLHYLQLRKLIDVLNEVNTIVIIILHVLKQLPTPIYYLLKLNYAIWWSKLFVREVDIEFSKLSCITTERSLVILISKGRVHVPFAPSRNNITLWTNNTTISVIVINITLLNARSSHSTL